MTPQEALHRANRAQAIFTDPLVKDTLDLMEREIMEAWMSCPVRDLEARETLWRMAVTTRKFRDILRGTMEAGKLAADQIRHQEQSRLDRVKNFIRR